MGPSFERTRAKPAMAPRAIASSVPKDAGVKRTMMAAVAAKARRRISGARLRCMARMACAITATATSCRPCRNASPALPARRRWPKAKASISSAEGRVNPSQAAMPPGNPALRIPIM